MAPPSQGFDLMVAFGLVEKEYASIRGVAMEPSAFGPTRTFTLFKDSQLTRRARWELGWAGEQGTLGASIGQTPGGTWTRGIRVPQINNSPVGGMRPLEVGWEGFCPGGTSRQGPPPLSP